MIKITEEEYAKLDSLRYDLRVRTFHEVVGRLLREFENAERSKGEIIGQEEESVRE